MRNRAVKASLSWLQDIFREICVGQGLHKSTKNFLSKNNNN